MSSSLIRRVKRSKKIREQLNKLNKANKKLKELQSIRDSLSELADDATSQLNHQINRLPDHVKSDQRINANTCHSPSDPTIKGMEHTDQQRGEEFNSSDELSNKLDKELDQLDELECRIKSAVRRGQSITEKLQIFKKVAEHFVMNTN